MLRKSIQYLNKRNLQQVQKILYFKYSQNASPEAAAAATPSTTRSWTRKSNDNETKEYFQKDDPDLFGTLSKAATNLIEGDKIDEGDVKEEEFVSEPPDKSKRLSTKGYADIIKAYIRKRQIKEAIDVLEVRMLQEDRVKPENYIYNLLLGACGRVGYTKKAFRLFNDMKKRGLKPTGGTYTALFNACSNSPWIEDGVSRARKLRELMLEQRVIANETNYNAMIKAFGRCGDLQTSFALVDEMIENQIPVKQDTINFLLQSCVSDKEAGFRHALLVWRKFHEKHITPDIYSFNLLLRCVRDCETGDMDSINRLLSSEQFKCLQSPPNLQLESPQNSNSVSAVTDVKHTSEEELFNWPNLIAPVPYLGNIIELQKISKPEHRLMLIGGCFGFFKNMAESNVTADIKTYTLLLDCIPATLAAERALLSYLKKQKLRYDADFLNMLMKKRCMRFDYDNAKSVLSMFKAPTLRPDIITYGILALTCKTKEEARDLLTEMDENGYRINIEILGAMLRQASNDYNFDYIHEILQIVSREQIKPNKAFMEHLQTLNSRCRQRRKEQYDKKFNNEYKAYRAAQVKWKQEVDIDETEDIHPWAQFRATTRTNVKNYKDPETRFKPRIKSRFRQKTGTLQ